MIIIAIFEESADSGFGTFLVILLCIALLVAGGTLAPALIMFPAMLVQSVIRGFWWAYALLGLSLILGIIGNCMASRDSWQATTIVDYAKTCGIVLSVIAVVGAVMILFFVHSDSIPEAVQSVLQVDFGALWAEFLEYINSFTNVLVLVLVIAAAIFAVVFACVALWASLTAIMIPILEFSSAWVGLICSVFSREKKNHIGFLFQYIEWIGYFLILEVAAYGVFALIGEPGANVVSFLKSKHEMLAFYYSIPWLFRLLGGCVLGSVGFAHVH